MSWHNDAITAGGLANGFPNDDLTSAEWVAIAITDAEGDYLRSYLHAMHAELEASGSYRPDQDIRQGVFARTNRMQEDDTVMSLLTQPKVFPKIVDIMGR